MEQHANPRRGSNQPESDCGAAYKEQAEGQPPDKVVVDADHAYATRPVVAEREHHTDRPENFSQEADSDNGPRSFELPCRVQIQEAVDADDHSEAGPNARIAWRRKVEQLEERERPEAGPQAKRQIVNAGQRE